MRLNLGCGRTTNSQFINIDFNIFLKLSRVPGLKRILSRLGIYYPKLDHVLIHDLRRGIPFPSNSIEVVYHSHLLEHIDFEQVNTFLKEIHRVLQVGGIHRIVIPNPEPFLLQIQGDITNYEKTGSYVGSVSNIHALLEQSVRKIPARIQDFRPFFRGIALRLFGDAQKRGETHQMMYSKAAVHEILVKNGFSKIVFLSPDKSQIPGWDLMNLDLDSFRMELHPGSTYVECRKE